MAFQSMAGNSRDEALPPSPPRVTVTWMQFLLRDFQPATPDSDSERRTDCIWSVLLVSVWIALVVGVTVALVRNWPAEPRVYTSNNAIPQDGFTCGCSLPLYLQEPDNAPSGNITLNLNQCYPRSSLETITILQYPTNNTEMDTIAKMYARENPLYVESPGYVVQEEAHELTVVFGYELDTLYRNEKIGFTDEDTSVQLEEILANGFMTFPQSSIRMAFQYECSNCSTCGLPVIKGYLEDVTRSTNEPWGSCYYWGQGKEKQCNTTGTYRGKCVLYPTKTLPFMSSVCNAFVNADDTRSIQLKCKNWKDDIDCEETVRKANLTMDNRHTSPLGVRVEAICHDPRHSCLSPSDPNLHGSKVQSYKVTRFVSSESIDPLNAYLNTSTLWKDWRYISGICINTYEQVYRFNKTMFLQAQCGNRTDLCTLTGRYYIIDDFFDQERRLEDRVFYNKTEGGDLFVCYKLNNQSVGIWLLNYVNVLFSWIGLLLFLYFSGVYKLYRFMRAKYTRR